MAQLHVTDDWFKLSEFHALLGSWFKNETRLQLWVWPRYPYWVERIRFPVPRNQHWKPEADDIISWAWLRGKDNYNPANCRLWNERKERVNTCAAQSRAATEALMQPKGHSKIAATAEARSSVWLLLVEGEDGAVKKAYAILQIVPCNLWQPPEMAGMVIISPYSVHCSLSKYEGEFGPDFVLKCVRGLEPMTFWIKKARISPVTDRWDLIQWIGWVFFLNHQFNLGSGHLRSVRPFITFFIKLSNHPLNRWRSSLHNYQRRSHAMSEDCQLYQATWTKAWMGKV